ncbi:glycosyl hydrolase catalytic core-domain-containing protein [Flammula alnicola]|nr:glycosyl hydrolase catalytic core-domain-containing protein [Flammula alnicola]
MVSVRIPSILCAIVLAGSVGASHIKRHRFQTRSQCRDRPHPTATEVAVAPCAVSSAHSVPSIPVPESGTPHSSSSSTPHLVFSSSESAHPTVTSSTHTATTTARVTSTAALVQVVATPSAKPLSSSLVPNNIKAGIAGGDAYPYMQDHIGWWYDWSPNPSKPGKPIAVPMLWGNGTADKQDAARLTAFEHLSTVPPFVLGFEEPDCPSGSGSAGMSVADGVSKWESLIAPLRAKGTKLGSPSMCKQADETWLAQFSDEISTPWDFTAIHINKNSLDGVKKDIEHYMTYGKPIWVTEFACVDDYQKFEPCTDQDEINGFINVVVDYFQSNSNVYAYAYSNGLGLGDVWPLMKDNSLSESGQTYLAAISKYH